MTLEQLYKTQRRHFIFQIYPYLKSFETAEELVQEAFLKAFNKISQYDPAKGTMKSWFNSILFSVMWNYKRQQKRIPYTVDVADYLDCEDFAYYEDTCLETILDSVKNIKHRRVLVLHLVLGYSLEEISVLMKEHQGNVRKIIQRYRIGFDHEA